MIALLLSLSFASPAHDLYEEGVALVGQGKLKAGVMTWRQAMITAADDPSGESDVWADHSLAGVARVYAGLGRYDTALEYYAMIWVHTKIADQLALERAWVSLLAGHDGDVPRLLKRVRGDPRARVLQAATLAGTRRERTAQRARQELVQSGAAPEWVAIADAVLASERLPDPPAPFPARAEPTDPVFDAHGPRIRGSIVQEHEDLGG